MDCIVRPHGTHADFGDDGEVASGGDACIDNY